MPLICPAASFAKEGGLFSLDVDYEEMGKELGEMANQILSGKKSAGEVKFQYPKETKLIINLKVAQKIGLKIPPSVLSKAKEVYR